MFKIGVWPFGWKDRSENLSYRPDEGMDNEATDQELL